MPNHHYQNQSKLKSTLIIIFEQCSIFYKKGFILHFSSKQLIKTKISMDNFISVKLIFHTSFSVHQIIAICILRSDFFLLCYNF